MGDPTIGSDELGADVSAPASARAPFLGARLLSQAGKSLFLAALFVASADALSASGLSAIIVATMAAAILFGIRGGIVADRLGASRALTVGTLLRLGAVLAAFSALAEPGYAWVAACAFSAASQPYAHAELAAVRHVRASCSNGTHASIVVLQHLGHGAGLLLLAPLLYLLGGEVAMLSGAALLYALTLPLTLLLHARLRQTGREWRIPTNTAIDLARTFRFFSVERRARYAAGVLAYSDLTTKSLLVAAPIYLSVDLDLDLDLGPGATASLIVAATTGVVLGLLWSGRVLTVARAPYAMRAVVLVSVACSLTLAGLGFALASMIGLAGIPGLSTLEDGTLLSFVLAIPAVFALGAAHSVSPVAARTVLTETAPPAEQARVFASVATLSDVLVILPLALAGVSAELLGARPTLLLVGLLGALVLVIFELRSSERPVGGPAAAHATAPAP